MAMTIVSTAYHVTSLQPQAQKYAFLQATPLDDIYFDGPFFGLDVICFSTTRWKNELPTASTYPRGNHTGTFQRVAVPIAKIIPAGWSLWTKEDPYSMAHLGQVHILVAPPEQDGLFSAWKGVTRYKEFDSVLKQQGDGRHWATNNYGSRPSDRKYFVNLLLLKDRLDLDDTCKWDDVPKQKTPVDKKLLQLQKDKSAYQVFVRAVAGAPRPQQAYYYHHHIQFGGINQTPRATPAQPQAIPVASAAIPTPTPSPANVVAASTQPAQPQAIPVAAAAIPTPTPQPAGEVPKPLPATDLVSKRPEPAVTGGPQQTQAAADVAVLGHGLFQDNKLKEAIAAYQQGRALARCQHNSLFEMYFCSWLGRCYFELKSSQEAAQYATEGLRHAEALATICDAYIGKFKRRVAQPLDSDAY